MNNAAGLDQSQRMDKMYRYQRYIYDVTRKHYLYGRDQLLDKLDIAAGARVLEVGCGTGRNLAILAQRYSAAQFYGVDASNEMLNSARSRMSREISDGSVKLACCLAEAFDYRDTFAVRGPFDVIFFSYVLSMIPGWQAALENALSNLKPGGQLFVLDFCDQGELPAWFRSALRFWLARFGVVYRPELLDHLSKLSETHGAAVQVDMLAKRYSFLAEVRPSRP
jgi:S-adenosylmethionine-diacylgycerolhomoserine-N-methlytransferase